MRPLDKGAWPTDNNGARIIVSEYKKWRSQLIARIGYYCVYCNIPLSHSLEVEHVAPKNPPTGVTPGSMLDWDNMLLACGPCNNAKGNKPINLSKLYFPESHNTLIPFSYEQHNAHQRHAIVVPSTDLNAQQKTKAEETIKLTELDNIDLRPDIVDIRSIKRKDANTMALESYSLFQKTKKTNPNDLTEIAKLLARVAKGYGFFGSWFRIFKNEPEMLQALLDSAIIPGTAQNCFDSANGFSLINRNPANTADPI